MAKKRLKKKKANPKYNKEDVKFLNIMKDYARSQKASAGQKAKISKRLESDAKRSVRLMKENERFRQEVYTWQKTIDAANKRFMELKEAGYSTIAMQEAIENAPGQYEGFNIDYARTSWQIHTEGIRASQFLEKSGSTVEGAKIERELLRGSKWYGQFGGEYKTIDNQFRGYSNRIDDKTASAAFKIYRMISEEKSTEGGASLIRSTYGSENLITAIYDILLESDTDFSNYNASTDSTEFLEPFRKQVVDSMSSMDLLIKQGYSDIISYARNNTAPSMRNRRVL